MTDHEVLVIGAGPYGLSVSSHLRALGVEHRIVGRPMNTWRTHMPSLMNLKSEPYASDISAPAGKYDIEEYCRLFGLDYVARLGPLTIRRFLDYADWFTEQLVPDVADVTVTSVSAASGGFRVTFADDDPISVRQLVLATGLLPFKVMPAELSGLPADLVSHSSDKRDLESFAGRRVAVLGAGQSALEVAALLHEAGAEVQLVYRRNEVEWLPQNPAHLNAIGKIIHPTTKTCEGWRCLVVDSPVAFGMLPESIRAVKARTVLGPAGSWWLKDRVEGVISALSGHQLRGAEPSGSGVRLLLDGPKQSSLEVDHVIAGTGFRVDIGKLEFLSADLLDSIATVNRYPVVTRGGATNVPGLYFAGVPTAVSLGPSVRFVAGTHNTSRRLAKSVSRRLKASATLGAPPAHSAPVAAG